MKKTFRVLPAVLLSAALLSSCNLLPEEEGYYLTPVIRNAETTDYAISECFRGDIVNDTTISFKYVPVQTASLSFAAGGLSYDTFFVNVGETVKEGQLLAQLDMEDLDEQIEALEREIRGYESELSQLEENRAMELTIQQYRGLSMEAADLQDALTSINQNYDRKKQNIEDSSHFASLRLEECREDVKDRQIYAPFDGLISYIATYTASDLSVEDRKVMTISDSSMSLFKAETTYWPYFEYGAEFTVTSNGEEYLATVCTEEELGLEPEEKKEGKNGTVYLVLNETALQLEDGDKGQVDLVLGHSENTLLVPSSAVSTINDEDVVYQMGEDGVRTYKKVKTGVKSGKYVEILSGLEEGEEVILN